jgi:hypothetical protein
MSCYSLYCILNFSLKNNIFKNYNFISEILLLTADIVDILKYLRKMNPNKKKLFIFNIFLFQMTNFILFISIIKKIYTRLSKKQ